MFPTELGAGVAARFDDAVLESARFGEELHRLMEAPQERVSSFTTLLKLPPTQAMQLIHSPDSIPAYLSGEFPPQKPYFQPMEANLSFPSNAVLIERAAKFLVFARDNNSPSSSDASLEKVKQMIDLASHGSNS